MRPIDLARPYGLSSQAIRTYEERGILPPAERSAGGHRRYGERHRLALASFRALAPAIGYDAASVVVGSAHRSEVDQVLTLLDRAHRRLAEDRATLDLLAHALGDAGTAAPPQPPAAPIMIGALAHRIGVTPATLRIWERAGVLRPARDPRSGHRIFGTEDLRDAHLARQLRHGHYPLARIAEILDEIRRHESSANLRRALEQWRGDLRERGLGLLRGEAALAGLVGARPSRG